MDLVNVSKRFYWFLLVGTYLYASLLITLPCMVKRTKLTYICAFTNLALCTLHFVAAHFIRFGHAERVCSGDFLTDNTGVFVDGYLVNTGAFIWYSIMIEWFFFTVAMFYAGYALINLYKNKDAKEVKLS